jgi:outer membrane protein with beta-barrel domain
MCPPIVQDDGRIAAYGDPRLSSPASAAPIAADPLSVHVHTCERFHAARCDPVAANASIRYRNGQAPSLPRESDTQMCVEEDTMKRVIAGFIVGLSIVAAGRASAQETRPGPGKAEVTVIPGGWTFFQSKGGQPSFGDYDLGGAFAYNLTRMVGVEGEVGGSIGVRQDLDMLSNLTLHEKTPNMLSYVGNVIVNAPGRSVVPYVTAGVGGMTLYAREILGIFNSDTFLTGNVGGGVKWYAPNDRWGLRGDYRFQAVRSRDTAPEFFGRETRYGQRIYGALVINVVK